MTFDSDVFPVKKVLVADKSADIAILKIDRGESKKAHIYSNGDKIPYSRRIHWCLLFSSIFLCNYFIARLLTTLYEDVFLCRYPHWRRKAFVARDHQEPTQRQNKRGLFLIGDFEIYVNS